MRNRQWTTLVTTTLIAISLVGCAVPGRFTREQYAQLDSDPFISDEPERSTVMSQVAGRAASMAGKQFTEPAEDHFAFAADGADGADEESPELQECEACDAPSLAEVQSQPEETLASFFEAPDEPVEPNRLMHAVAETEADFSDFINNQKSKVVNASAEFIDSMESTRKDVRQTVEQSGFWGNQENSSVDPAPVAKVTGETEDNPFLDDSDGGPGPNPFAGGSSVPAVAPPADVFGDAPDSANWPPGDFEFN